MSKRFRLIDKRSGELVFDGEEASRRHPCPICAHLHRHPSWCLVDPVRGLSICQRVEGPRRIGDAGYLFRWDGAEIRRELMRSRSEPEPKPDIDWRAMRAKALANPDRQRMTEELAAKWGVPWWCVDAIGTGWDGSAYLFPLHDREFEPCGMRVRPAAGKGRWSVTGSTTGLLVPAGFKLSGSLLVTEGESDLAALLSVGFQGLGRPGCGQCTEQLVELAKGRELVLIRDDDAEAKKNWGQRGAARLLERAKGVAKLAVAIAPPRGYKDLRAWVNDRGPDEVRAALERRLRALRKPVHR